MEARNGRWAKLELQQFLKTQRIFHWTKILDGKFSSKIFLRLYYFNKMGLEIMAIILQMIFSISIHVYNPSSGKAKRFSPKKAIQHRLSSVLVPFTNSFHHLKMARVWGKHPWVKMYLLFIVSTYRLVHHWLSFFIQRVFGNIIGRMADILASSSVGSTDRCTVFHTAHNFQTWLWN